MPPFTCERELKLCNYVFISNSTTSKVGPYLICEFVKYEENIYLYKARKSDSYKS